MARVIDGDTIELSGGDKLRLLSVDTPEKTEQYYSEAKAFLERVALHEKARIEYASTRRDKYGRLLGYLYIDTLFGFIKSKQISKCDEEGTCLQVTNLKEFEKIKIKNPTEILISKINNKIEILEK